MGQKKDIGQLFENRLANKKTIPARIFGKR